jgi:hypothetical protein
MAGTATGLKDGSQPTGSFSWRLDSCGTSRTGFAAGRGDGLLRICDRLPDFVITVVLAPGTLKENTTLGAADCGAANRSCLGAFAGGAQRASKLADRAVETPPREGMKYAVAQAASSPAPAQVVLRHIGILSKVLRLDCAGLPHSLSSADLTRHARPGFLR